MPLKYILYLVVLLNVSCYSFKGISIPPEISTFYVNNFDNRALEAPSDLDVRFSEALRAKIRNESRLKYNETSPDIEFAGEITNYAISSEAPTNDNTVALNRLDITINLRYTNNLNEKENWNKPYTMFATFDSNSDFNVVQDQKIKEIFDAMTEKIFNESFTNW
jgi:hypothetical protein